MAVLGGKIIFFKGLAIETGQLVSPVTYPDIVLIIFDQFYYPAIPQPFRLGIIFKGLAVEATQAVPGTAPHVAPAVFEQREYLILHQSFAYRVFHDGALLGQDATGEEREAKEKSF